MTNHNYSDLVAQAEKAVAAVKDPDLKRIAFQKVLDDLLGASDSSEPRKGDKVHGTTRKPVRAKSGSAPMSKGGPTAYIEELIGEDFFKAPKSIAQERPNSKTEAITFQLLL
jgi:hypothetical protein